MYDIFLPFGATIIPLDGELILLSLRLYVSSPAFVELSSFVDKRATDVSEIGDSGRDVS